MLHRRIAAALSAALALTGCNDEIDFGFGDWEADVDTVTLYTVDRPEFQGLPSAYDIRATRTLRVEDPSATGQWDFALTGGADGEPLTLTPLGAFFELSSQAGIAAVSGTFDDFATAPTDSAAYVIDAPVVLDADTLYVVRSRQAAVGGSACNNFAKIDPLEVDQLAGTFTFRVTANPNCNDSALVPPEDD